MQENKLYLAVLHSIWISHKKFFSIFNDNLFKIDKNYKEFYEKLNKDELEKFWFKNSEITSNISRTYNCYFWSSWYFSSYIN